MRTLFAITLLAFANAASQGVDANPFGPQNDVADSTNGAIGQTSDLPPTLDGVTVDENKEVEVNYDGTVDENEDFNIQTTTDYKDNADSLGDKVDMTWDNMTLNDFDFTNLVDTVDNDAVMQELVKSVRGEWMDYYTQQTAKLPAVCSGGQACRADIKKEAKSKVASEWNTSITSIRKTIKDTIERTKKKMESSYTKAYNCYHGCGCQFIENRFAFIMTQTDKYDKLIKSSEDTIDETWKKINGVHETCDFSAIDKQYKAQWDTMQS